MYLIAALQMGETKRKLKTIVLLSAHTLYAYAPVLLPAHALLIAQTVALSFLKHYG